MGTGALRRPQDCAQIVGVGDLVTDHQQRRLSPVGGSLQDVLHRGVLPHGGKGDNALMGVGAGHTVQLPPVGIHHHDARRTRLGGDVSQRLIRLAPGDVNFIHGGAHPQCFDDRVAPLDNAVRLRVRQRPPVLRVLPLSHGQYLALHIVTGYYSILFRQYKGGFIEILQENQPSAP